MIWGKKARPLAGVWYRNPDLPEGILAGFGPRKTGFWPLIFYFRDFLRHEFRAFSLYVLGPLRRY